jgi:hypothetical protein
MCLDSGRAEMYIGRHTFSNGSNRPCAATEGTDTDESQWRSQDLELGYSCV